MTNRLNYELRRSRRRTLTVEVDQFGNVVVRAPLHLSQRLIEHFVQSKADWITQNLRNVEAKRQLVPQRTDIFDFYHCGQVLRWGWSNADVIVPQRVTTVLAALRWVERWQRDCAHSVLSGHIDGFLPSIGLPALRYTGLQLRRMRKRWGACTNTGKITLNEVLIRVPDGCQRSVVAHEVCHLVHLNHGPGFRQLLDDVFPENRLADAVLDAWSGQTDVFEQISSNAVVKDAAIISGDLPSM